MNYFVDFDGVILDSQDRFQLAMKDNIDFNDWMDYLNSINWYKFIRECEEIDGSISALNQLQELNRLKAIITSIHSFMEGREKVAFLREKKIYVPVLYVLPRQKKSEVYLPSKDDILIDDKLRNCQDWEKIGGKAILFDSHLHKEEKNKIKSLKQLIY